MDGFSRRSTATASRSVQRSRARGESWRIAAALLVLASPLAAQINPSHHWRTIHTRHFYVTYTPPLEGLARRIAADAERAYGQLAQQLHPPRGPIDIVLSDDADFSNGSATPFPTNRIVVYANPPVSESALRYTNDWGQLVITHELTHIFHLDRTRGIWALGQDIFGRASTLFPNLYDPSWLTEGLAVYEESRLAGAGRVEGSEHRMIARAAAIDHTFPGLGSLSLAYGRYPFGEQAYAYGSLFVDYLARTHGDSSIRKLVDKSAADIIPYLIDIPAHQAFGESFTKAWREFTDSVVHSVRLASPPPLAGWRQLTRDGVYVYDPRWIGDTAVVYSGAPGRETFGAYRVDVAGKRKRIGRRNGQSPNVRLANGDLLYAQLDFTNPYEERSDLWIQHRGHERQLTRGQRLSSPDARADGLIVAEQVVPGATRLVLVSRDGKRVTPLTSGSYDEQWTEPRWSHAGDRIVASRWLHGDVSQIVVIDTTGRIVHVVSSGNSIEATGSWLPGDDGIVYSSDRTGATQLYVERFGDEHAFTNAHTDRLSDVETGLFEPVVAPDADRLAAVHFRADGYHLGVASCCAQGAPVAPYVDSAASPSTAPVITDTSAAHAYSAWHSLWPRYWLPAMDQGLDGGYRIGGTTSGADVIGRHRYDAELEVPTNDKGVVWSGSYDYYGLGLPVLSVDVAQDWSSLGEAFDRNASRTPIGELLRRTWTGDLLATYIHQRYRSVFALTGGAGVEHRTHVTSPSFPITLIDTTGRFGSPTYPTLIAGASFSNYQRPPFAISPEDGIQAAVTARDRLASGPQGTGASSVSVVGLANVFKSLDLPGFAHHVLALHGAAGWTDERANGYFEVGGVSGGVIQIIPGYTVGEGARTFQVRGFEPGTLIGIRALSGSAEYRMPLFFTNRAPGSLPLFFDRSSLTLFGDYGTAWCPTAVATREVCTSPSLTQQLAIASVGGELNLTTAVLSWDTPYQFRLGAAHPVENGALFARPSLQWYVTVGVPF